MDRAFSEEAWDDYVWWQSQNKKTLKRINKLIDDIDANGNMGLGKPEMLMFDLSGWWSRRIDEKNRLVYRIEGDTIQIASCRYHYDDK